MKNYVLKIKRKLIIQMQLIYGQLEIQKKDYM